MHLLHLIAVLARNSPPPQVMLSHYEQKIIYRSFAWTFGSLKIFVIRFCNTEWVNVISPLNLHPAVYPHCCPEASYFMHTIRIHTCKTTWFPDLLAQTVSHLKIIWPVRAGLSDAHFLIYTSMCSNA